MLAEDMYREQILDYYRHPRNFGTLDAANARAADWNPVCGDKMEMFVAVANNRISDIKFMGSGCAISISSASLLTEAVKGKHIDEAIKLDNDAFISELGVTLSPVRRKCALLGLKVLKMALVNYLSTAP